MVVLTITPSARRFLPPRIIRRVHVNQFPRPGAMQLDDDVALRPREMPHPRRNHTKCAFGKIVELRGIQLSAHPDLQRPVDDCHMFWAGVEMNM